MTQNWYRILEDVLNPEPPWLTWKPPLTTRSSLPRDSWLSRTLRASSPQEDFQSCLRTRLSIQSVWFCSFFSPFLQFLRAGTMSSLGFPDGSMLKNPPANAGDTGNADAIPGSGRSPAGGHGNPLQYSCLGNSTNRRAWRVIVHGGIKSQTLLNTHALGTVSSLHCL